jgi:hypothetical protein
VCRGSGHTGFPSMDTASMIKSAAKSESNKVGGIQPMNNIRDKVEEVASNLPSKEDFDKNKDLNGFDPDGLLAALKANDRTRRLIAIEKMGQALWSEDSSRVETALVTALRDKDKYVAIRSANTLLMEKEEYRKHVVEAMEDSSIDEGIRHSFRAMIAYTDGMKNK